MSQTTVMVMILISLAISALALVWRAVSGKPRTYTPIDAVSSLIEIGLLMWGVVYLATTC